MKDYNQTVIVFVVISLVKMFQIKFHNKKRLIIEVKKGNFICYDTV